MTEIEKQEEKINAAYVAGRDAIVKALGTGAESREQVLDVVLMFAYELLTDFGRLPLSGAQNNAEFFYEQLKNLIESTQKEIKPDTYVGRMM